MKGLLLKDLYTITKQTRLFLVFIVIFALMPGFSMASFAIVYAAMLPISALAYDERCRWNELAAAMPYSSTELVFSKYVLGILGMVAATAIALAAKFVPSVLTGTAVDTESLYLTALVFCVGLLFISVNLPVMFRFGTEKGRLVMFAMAAMFVLALTFFDDRIAQFLSGPVNLPFVTVLAAAGSLVLLLVSALISISINEHAHG